MNSTNTNNNYKNTSRSQNSVQGIVSSLDNKIEYLIQENKTRKKEIEELKHELQQSNERIDGLQKEIVKYYSYFLHIRTNH